MASQVVLNQILAKSILVPYSPGDELFKQGDPADYFSIVHSGVVEIVAETPKGPKILSYIGPSECIGEVALLIGKPRTATARVPERAEVINITKDVFEELILRFPVFLRQLCGILAQRLDRATSGGDSNEVATASDGPPTLLEGNLKFFDLASMLQTLVDSRKTGRMFVETGEGEDSKAEIYIDNGSIIWAKTGRIQGEEAVYQLFQMGADGRFQFIGGEQVPANSNISEAPMMILLEAARLQDEYRAIRRKLPDHTRLISTAIPQMKWEDEDTWEYAEKVWEALTRQPTALGKLLKYSPFSHARIYHVIWELLKTGQIEYQMD